MSKEDYYQISTKGIIGVGLMEGCKLSWDEAEKILDGLEEWLKDEQLTLKLEKFKSNED